MFPVILHHAGFPWLPGGFLGVDVFFVISGYLITAIISGELREGRFSLLRFYERRARRILPTLFLVLGLCTIFAWFWLFPKEFSDFGMSLAGVATFMSNFVFWAQSGYFADAADSKPLIHTWTLAVEEQFYILFPVLLMWMASRSDKTVRATVVALLFLSLMAAEIGTRAVPGITFYMLPTRAFELMIGALFALAPPSYSARARTFGHELGSLAGIALIIAGFLLLDSKSRIPGLLALIPTMGTLLVLMFAVPGTLTQHLLAGKVPVAIGLVSYSAYLWHQPLMAFARQRHLGEPPLVLMLGLGLASLALAAISWRFVEAPFRDKERVSRKTIFAISLAGIALFGTVGLLIVAKDGFPGRFDSRLHSILAVRND